MNRLNTSYLWLAHGNIIAFAIKFSNSIFESYHHPLRMLQMCQSFVVMEMRCGKLPIRAIQSGANLGDKAPGLRKFFEHPKRLPCYCQR